jgi:8-oxo-dGTP pyrophosphatase MutT (NUDIX family)
MRVVGLGVTDAVPAITRDFTVAVLVTHEGRVLLHHHVRLNRWLPPGGHVEPNELPDDAARREVEEETGVIVRLIGEPAIDVDLPGQPRQLCPPVGIQVTPIEPGHEHIDLIYLAEGAPAEPRAQVDWFAPNEWAALCLTEEVAAWCQLAIDRADARRDAMLCTDT